MLLFCVDEMRADHMGCAGNPIVKTPNIDRIASQGTLFTNSYCANPICMPARASIFTGMLPRDHGVRINGQGLRADVPTLPGALAESGYATHAAGKLHLTPWVPKESPPDPNRFPESLSNWSDGRMENIFHGSRNTAGSEIYSGQREPWILLGPLREPIKWRCPKSCTTLAISRILQFNASGRRRQPKCLFFPGAHFLIPMRPSLLPYPTATCMIL